MHVQALDLESQRVPVHAVDQPVGTGNDEGPAGLAGHDFAFLDEVFDVVQRPDGEQGLRRLRVACGVVHGLTLHSLSGPQAGREIAAVAPRRTVRASAASGGLPSAATPAGAEQ